MKRRSKNLIISLFCVVIFISCMRDVPAPLKNIDLVEPGDFLLVEASENAEYYDLFYGDSLSLTEVDSTLSTKVEIDNDLFDINNNKIFLKDKNNISHVYETINLVDLKSNKKLSIKVKLRFWLTKKYGLKVQERYPPQNILVYTSSDTTYIIEKNTLFYFTKQLGEKVYCTSFPLEGGLYNQMICKNGYYAIRTENKIYLSNNLTKWDIIYNDKRAIKESMVITQNENGDELLFSEYTPGIDYKRHHIYAYNLRNKTMSIRMTFYKRSDFYENKLQPYARHIHFLVQDKYSDNIFIGTGDSQGEAGIYFSEDMGITFKKLGGGNEKWRSLAMMFNSEFIFWNMDSAEPQYLFRLNRKDLQENVSWEKIDKYPLINSALWCSAYVSDFDMYIMSSNGEGQLYDNKFRNYGISIAKNRPEVYELQARKCKGIDGKYAQYSQFMPIGTDVHNFVYFVDLENNYIYKCKVTEIK
ncbi:hypothetical protein [Proteiniphilum sp. X52]|uniref:hypothetical protein n=1 Tax=Proteiniphilum sp. X52 TaxID=2382159 RepID=UPI0011CE7F3D|nr:hypothetical protein [Proteiniphilum sp. X52]